MRADRLIQALLLLQGRQRITAAELAAELEVSVPTARRDLEALAMAGVPLYPSRGKGGGWRLIGGARTDLTGLTSPEAIALLIGLTQSAGASPDRIAAMRKLVRAMPEPFREGAQRAASATVREAPWGRREPQDAPAAVGQLQQAIAQSRRVRIDYSGTRTNSVVELVPLVVGSRGDRWYLIAAPPEDERGTADASRLRTYRVDRIRSAQILPSRGEAPGAFDHARAWADMVARVEERRGAARAVVVVKADAAGALLERFGAQARVIDDPAAESSADLVCVEVRAHRLEALAEQLVGWSDVAEVMEPPELRRALFELASRVRRMYADSVEEAPEHIR